MRLISKSLVLVFGIGALLTYSGCGPDPGQGPSVEEVQLGKLSGTWTLTAGNVTLDDVSKMSDYANFELDIAGTAGASSFGYNTRGRPSLSPWLSSGSWSFGADPAVNIVRDPGTADQLDITYSVSDTQLQLEFSFSGDGYARTKEVKGDWIFTFTK